MFIVQFNVANVIEFFLFLLLASCTSNDERTAEVCVLLKTCWEWVARRTLCICCRNISFFLSVLCNNHAHSFYNPILCVFVTQKNHWNGKTLWLNPRNPIKVSLLLNHHHHLLHIVRHLHLHQLVFLCPHVVQQSFSMRNGSGLRWW